MPHLLRTRVVEGINDLVTLEPELTNQWSKRNKLKPTEVSIGSHKKVIWRCDKGHEWKAAIKSRTINKTGCPYGSHNKVLAGFIETTAQNTCCLKRLWKSNVRFVLHDGQDINPLIVVRMHLPRCALSLSANLRNAANTPMERIGYMKTATSIFLFLK